VKSAWFGDLHRGMEKLGPTLDMATGQPQDRGLSQRPDFRWDIVQSVRLLHRGARL